MSKLFIKVLTLILITAILFTGIIGCNSSNKEDDKQTTGTLAASDSTKSTETKAQEQAADPNALDPNDPKLSDFGGRKIVLAYPGVIDNDPNTETGQRRIKRIAELEKKYNTKLELLPISGGEYTEKIYPTIMSGDPICDFMAGTPSTFYNQISGNLIYPLSDLNVINFEDKKWDQTVIQATTYKNKNYGIYPYSRDVGKVLYFNKSLLEREGIEDLYSLQKTDQWTWDKMLEIAKKITKDTDGDGKTDQWGFADDEYDIAQNLILSNGGNILQKNEDGTPRFALNDPKALEALNVYQQWCQSDKVVYYQQEGMDNDYGRKIFRKGTIAFLPGYTWFASHIFKKGMKDDYGLIMWPKSTKSGKLDKYMANQVWWGYWFMPSTVKEPAQVAKFFNDYFDPLYSDEEAEKAYWNDMAATLRDEESLETLKIMLEPGTSIPNSFYSFSIHWGVIFTAFNSISTGAKTPVAAMQEIEPVVNGIIDKEIGAVK